MNQGTVRRQNDIHFLDMAVRLRLPFSFKPKQEPAKPISLLLALPGELRNQIYDLVFTDSGEERVNLCQKNRTHEKGKKPSRLSHLVRVWMRHRKSDFALSHTCRQIRRETEFYRYAHRTYGIFTKEDNGCRYEKDVLAQRIAAFNTNTATHATQMRHLELGLCARPNVKYRPSKLQRLLCWLRCRQGFPHEDEQTFKKLNRQQLVTSLLDLQAPKIKILTVHELWLDAGIPNFLLWLKGIFPDLEDVRIMRKGFRGGYWVNRLRFEEVNLVWWYTGEMAVRPTSYTIGSTKWDALAGEKQRAVLWQMWWDAELAGRLKPPEDVDD